MYGVGWLDLDRVEWPDFVLMAARVDGMRAARRRAEREAEKRWQSM